MKKFLLILIITLYFTLTGCNYHRKSEEIVLFGKTNNDNLLIPLDDGWFTEHSKIVVNYKDSVLIIPLTRDPINNKVEIIR